jgi:hypothetical protein
MEPIELPEFRLTANNSKSCSTGCAGSVIRANGAVPQTVHRKGFQVYDYRVSQDLACNSQLWLLFRPDVRPLHNNQVEQAALCHFVVALYSRVVGPFRILLG